MSEQTAPTAPEPGVEADGIDTPTLVMWGFVSVVLTVSVMLGAAALFYQAQNNLDAKRIVKPNYVDSDQVVSDQEGLLAGYRPPASEGKPYTIPISRAKELVLRDLQSATN